MNRSLLEIYRFILGYNFSAGIKSGLGIFVPLIILLNLDLPFKNILAFCFGAIVISIADQIGPIKHRRTEIAGTWILSTVIAFIGSHLNGQNPYVGIFIVCVTFIGSLSGAFGKKGSSIGFALIFSAILSIKPTEFPIQYTIMTSLGGLTYGLYALIIAYFWQKKTTRQALADNYFLLAKYFRSLSECYRQNNSLDDSYEALMKAQAGLIEGQQKTRDLLYRKRFIEDPDYLKMTNELLILIDIQEKITSPFQDFRIFRSNFSHSDIQIFFRDLTRKAAINLEEISLHSLGGSKSLQRLGFKAELRALEYEIEIKKQNELPTNQPESYQLLIGHFRKYWSIARQLEKLRKLHIDEIPSDSNISGQFSKFITHNPWAWNTLKAQFTPTSTMLRHSLRTSFAMALGLIILAYTPFLNHGFWITFTIASLMSPGFSITRQKTRDRIFGTIIGCIVGGIIISYNLTPIAMICVLFVCMVLSNGLSNVRLDVSVVFNSVYVLLLSNYQYPSDTMLVGERILDTLFGAFIAITFSYLLPSWERLEVTRLKNTVRTSISKLIQAIEDVWFKKISDPVEYRLNRQAAQTAMAELVNCFQRMQREPKKQQANLEALSYFISRNQSIISQLMQFSSALTTLKQDPKKIPEFYELFLIIKIIIDDQANQSMLSPDYNPINPLSAQEIKPLIWQIDDLIALENKL